MKAARIKEKADESKLAEMTINQARLPVPEKQIQPRRQPRNRRRKSRKNLRRKQNDLKKFQWRRAFRKFWKWLKQTQFGGKRKNRRNRKRKQNRRNRFRRPNINEKYDEEEARYLFETTFGSLHEK